MNWILSFLLFYWIERQEFSFLFQSHFICFGIHFRNPINRFHSCIHFFGSMNNNLNIIHPPTGKKIKSMFRFISSSSSNFSTMTNKEHILHCINKHISLEKMITNAWKRMEKIRKSWYWENLGSKWIEKKHHLPAKHHRHHHYYYYYYY